LAEIIEPRAEEIFTLVAREIQKTGYEERVASGVVITGGTSCLHGMVEIAEKVTNLPVRRSGPSGVGGLIDVVSSPIYATGVGLVLYARKNQDRDDLIRMRRGGMFQKMGNRMKSWVKEFF
ncbi:MAG TPA: cell division protein FtsA, partial [Nitrospiria bacterium]|nr:cell division protein FtsA [Nitrospiria bacterium]